MQVFIKTTNSPVCSQDLAGELEMYDIAYTLDDDGVYVNEKDYDQAISVLKEMEVELCD